MFIIEHYTTETGSDPIKDYLDKVSKKYGVKELSSVDLSIKLLANHGFDANKYRHNIIKRLDGDLCELRPGSNRVFFAMFDGNRFVLLHGFRKQSQATPRKEIELAIKRLNNYKRRYGR